MAGGLQALTLIVAVALLSWQPVSAQDPDTASRLSHNLSFILPVVIVFIILIIIIVVIVFVARRARYGAFCCIKPRMSYRPQYSPTNAGDGEAGTGSEPTSLPTYNQPPQVCAIAPPDYHDALQDVLVSSGPASNNNMAEYQETSLEAVEEQQEEPTMEEQQEEPAMEQPDISDDSVSYDDRTPLNP